MTMKHEIYNLQILRGIAALLVVFEHLAPPFISKGLPYGEVGVSIFFFISGFIMVYSFKESESGLSFFKRRILRIYPPYLILSIPLILYFFLKTDSFLYLLHNITLFPFIEWNSSMSESLNVKRSVASPVAWTLYYEMYFYFIFSVMKFLFSNREKVVLMTSITMVSVLITSSFFIKNSDLGFKDLSLANIISSLSILSFVAGMLSLKYIRIIKERPRGICYFMIIILSLIIINRVNKYGLIESSQVIDLLFSSIPSWILCMIIIRSEKYKGVIFDAAHRIGAISYSLYLFHSNFYILKNEMQLSAQYQLLFFIISTIISIYIASLSFRYIESNSLFRLKRS